MNETSAGGGAFRPLGSRLKKRARGLAALWTMLLAGLVVALPVSWIWAMRQLGASELEYSVRNVLALWILWGVGYALLVVAMTDSHKQHARFVQRQMKDTGEWLRSKKLEAEHTRE